MTLLGQRCLARARLERVASKLVFRHLSLSLLPRQDIISVLQRLYPHHLGCCLGQEIKEAKVLCGRGQGASLKQMFASDPKNNQGYGQNNAVTSTGGEEESKNRHRCCGNLCNTLALQLVRLALGMCWTHHNTGYQNPQKQTKPRHKVQHVDHPSSQGKASLCGLTPCSYAVSCTLIRDLEAALVPQSSAIKQTPEEPPILFGLRESKIFTSCSTSSKMHHNSLSDRKSSGRQRRKRKRSESHINDPAEGDEGCFPSQRSFVEWALSSLDRNSRQLLQRFASDEALRNMELVLLHAVVLEGNLTEPLGLVSSQPTWLGKLVHKLENEHILAIQNKQPHQVISNENGGERCRSSGTSCSILVIPSSLHRRLLHCLCKVYGIESESAQGKGGRKAVLVKPSKAAQMKYNDSRSTFGDSSIKNSSSGDEESSITATHSGTQTCFSMKSLASFVKRGRRSSSDSSSSRLYKILSYMNLHCRRSACDDYVINHPRIISDAAEKNTESQERPFLLAAQTRMVGHTSSPHQGSQFIPFTSLL